MSRPHTITPVVSVVMPTYNGERFLRPAIDSILDQTFEDFELIVVDDSSTDSTPYILSQFKDDRVVVLKNESNQGIAKATNRGLAVARGEYVALQDHDDISLSNRLQTEVDFLNSHPEIALVGSAATLIDENGVAYEEFPHPTGEIDLGWELLWRCVIHHTAVMVRRNAILDIGGYLDDPSLRFAADYDLLSRLARRYRAANLPESLVLWRRYSDQTSIRHRQSQQGSGEAISFRNVCMLVNGRGRQAAEAYRPASLQHSLDRQWFRYLGLKAFLFSPAGELPTLPAQQVVAGLSFLNEIQSAFYREHDFPRSAVVIHRRHLNWIWGKHAVALALRARWAWRDRIRILAAGVASLGSALAAAISAAGMKDKGVTP